MRRRAAPDGRGTPARDAPGSGAPGPRPGRRQGAIGDRGSGSLLAVLAIAVLAAVAGAAVAVGGSLIVRARASAAADLAALAGAGAALEGEAAACGRAAAIAAANGATLTTCRLDAAQAWVEVWVPVPPGVTSLIPGSPARVRARAHAELVARER